MMLPRLSVAMRFKTIMLVLATISPAFVAGQVCAGEAPPPPVVTPRASFGAASNLVARPELKVSNEAGDAIFLEADTLEDQPSASDFRMKSSARARVVTLEGGSTLRIDDQTPEGTYDLQDGSQVVLPREKGYPRWVRTIAPSLRVLNFTVTEPVRIGVLMSGDSTSKDIDDYLRALASGASASVFLEESRDAAYECPKDGPYRGGVFLNSSRTAPVFVTWFALDSGRAPTSSQATGLRRTSDKRAEWSATRAPSPEGYPLALTSAAAAAGLRAVGRARIDLNLNSVTIIQSAGTPHDE